MISIEADDDLYIGDELLQEFTLCLDCGLCCKFFDSLPIYEEEIDELIATLQMTKTEFKKTYTKRIQKKDNKEKVSLKTPCPFQQGNLCQIYPKRWFICRTFPLLINITKKVGILSGIYVCPQATQFYEGMLDFYQHHQQYVYHQLVEKEKQLTIGKNGMKINGPIEIFSFYLDWLHRPMPLEKKNR
jgi:Fe-S-cluster containining protein